MQGVNARKKEVGERRKGSTRGHEKKGLKVVYISSPMMVKTSAAEFRATVQELTGRDSDVARLMESGDWYNQNREEAEGLRPRSEDRPQNSNQSSDYFVSDSPSESDSLFQDMGLQQHHRDLDVYTSSLFQDSTLLEVIGNFDLY